MASKIPGSFRDKFGLLLGAPSTPTLIDKAMDLDLNFQDVMLVSYPKSGNYSVFFLTP